MRSMLVISRIMNEFLIDPIFFARETCRIRFLGPVCFFRDKVRNGSEDNGEVAKGRRESTEPPLIIGISRSLGAYHNTMYN